MKLCGGAASLLLDWLKQSMACMMASKYEVAIILLSLAARSTCKRAQHTRNSLTMQFDRAQGSLVEYGSLLRRIGISTSLKLPDVGL